MNKKCRRGIVTNRWNQMKNWSFEFLEDCNTACAYDVSFTCARLLAIQDPFYRTTRNDCNALWWLDASIIPRGKHTTYIE